MVSVAQWSRSGLGSSAGAGAGLSYLTRATRVAEILTGSAIKDATVRKWTRQCRLGSAQAAAGVFACRVGISDSPPRPCAACRLVRVACAWGGVWVLLMWPRA